MPCHFKHAENMRRAQHGQRKGNRDHWNGKVPTRKGKFICIDSLLGMTPLKPKAEPHNNYNFIGKNANQ